MTLVLDNTVLSNFALVKRIDLLRYFAAQGLVTSEATWQELQLGVELGRVPDTDWSWLSVLPLLDGEGNLVLRAMIGHGYRCPVEHL